MARSAKAATRSELAPGEAKTIRVDGKLIALYNVEGTFYATDDVCIHQGGPPGEGRLGGYLITCPWHFWRYDVRTGRNGVDPSLQLETYPVRVDGDDILVDI